MHQRFALSVLIVGAVLLAFCFELGSTTCSAGPEKTFQDELLDKLVGRWRLSGTMMGQERKAEWVLNHQFVRLSCRETKEPPVLKVPYEAVTYIGCSSEAQRYVNYLLDVFGAGDFGFRTPNGQPHRVRLG